MVEEFSIEKVIRIKFAAIILSSSFKISLILNVGKSIITGLIIKVLEYSSKEVKKLIIASN